MHHPVSLLWEWQAVSTLAPYISRGKRSKRLALPTPSLSFCWPFVPLPLHLPCLFLCLSLSLSLFFRSCPQRPVSPPRSPFSRSSSLNKTSHLSSNVSASHLPCSGASVSHLPGDSLRSNLALYLNRQGEQIKHSIDLYPTTTS